ncbi:MAG: hypothetical protein PSX36_10890 [bacterium]|nr:hypothetical protein [bacterium]
MFKTLLVCIVLAQGLLKAQSTRFDMLENGNEHYQNKNFLSAIPIYKSELKKDPWNNELKYRLGLCYLNTRINRETAITYLEELSKDKSTESDVWIHLGHAYLLTNRIEDAVKCFEKFMSLKPRRADEVEHFLEQCANAEAFLKSPVKITFQNLGTEINSSEPDYYPYIDRDEMTLVFTSRRKENFGGRRIEMDGYRSSDIYISTMQNGNWTEAKNVGRNVNGNLDEQSVGLRSDGLELYMYLDHIDKYGDVYVSRRPDVLSEFLRPKVCDPIINEEIETAGCLSEDGELMVFARRNKLNDNSDLYTCRRLPNGKWGIPQRLPDCVNSPYNEDMPYLSYDGKTLYFASEGHNSMGGFDLFKSEWDQETNTFKPPVNLGCPINSTDDDRSICVTRDNRLAYVSSFRAGGFGDLDIYRVKFEEDEPIRVIYTGQLLVGDSTQQSAISNYDISLTVTNTKTNDEYVFTPQAKTGHFMMALPAGTYKLSTTVNGDANYEEDLLVSDMGRINMERHKDIILKKPR